jgi:hypothetical protein
MPCCEGEDCNCTVALPPPVCECSTKIHEPGEECCEGEDCDCKVINRIITSIKAGANTLPLVIEDRTEQVVGDIKNQVETALSYVDVGGGGDALLPNGVKMIVEDVLPYTGTNTDYHTTGNSTFTVRIEWLSASPELIDIIDMFTIMVTELNDKTLSARVIYDNGIRLANGKRTEKETVRFDFGPANTGDFGRKVAAGQFKLNKQAIQQRERKGARHRFTERVTV